MNRVVALACAVTLAAGAVGPAGAGAQELSGSPDGPSYVKTLGGTVGGGVVGAAAIALPMALLFELTTEDGVISSSSAGVILGAPIGYWLGQAWGASWGSGTSSHRVSATRYLLPAALWTGAGLGVYALIGDGFDPEDGERPDYTSWYVGAVVGGLVQVLGMSVTAHYMAAGDVERPGPSPVSLRLRPGPNGGLVAETGVRLAW